MTPLRPACAAALLLLALSSCTRKETKRLLEPSQALGTVLAEETARAAGPRKQVALILPHWAAASSAGDSFKAGLNKKGLAVSFTLSAPMGDLMGRHPVGLKAADFLATLERGDKVGAIVSLAGAPLLQAPDLARLKPDHPPVLVVATSSLGQVMGVPGKRSALASLLEAKVIQLAIVDGGAEPGTAPSGKLDAAHRSFSEHYHLLRAPD